MTDKKIRCIIIEDEDMATRLLVDYISSHPDLELIATFDSPVDFLGKKDNLDIDLMFLDIMMPEMTGMDLLRTIPLNCEVIITSASQDYALECYPLKVADYLLKPFRKNRFLEAVDNAIELIYLKRNNINSVRESSNKTHMLIKVDKRLMKVKIADILYVEAAWEYAKIYTKDQTLIVLSQIKNLERELEASSFFRIHRSFLINLDHVSYVEGNQVCIEKKKLPVSRTYRSELIKKLCE